MPLDSTQLKFDEVKRAYLFRQATPLTDALTLLYHEWGQQTPDALRSHDHRLHPESPNLPRPTHAHRRRRQRLHPPRTRRPERPSLPPLRFQRLLPSPNHSSSRSLRDNTRDAWCRAILLRSSTSFTSSTSSTSLRRFFYSLPTTHYPLSPIKKPAEGRSLPAK